ncbi:hypothetical protein [Natronococcus sp. A-GB7]|uniref:hypothetical protein n=1 Tax=Natronococcus sp. A-GB7 TaxID=3037649 RepID=UPI00241BF7B1|nr:hypothetical protein [Natronococcus sp. A-GB7]MDG5818352.1 hypothetical protein [Natronococcus sp. A-GB7]
MSPSAFAAVALLGLWVLMMFAVTAATGEDQLRTTAWLDDSTADGCKRSRSND